MLRWPFIYIDPLLALSPSVPWVLVVVKDCLVWQSSMSKPMAACYIACVKCRWGPISSSLYLMHYFVLIADIWLKQSLHKWYTVYGISCFSPHVPNLNVEMRVLKVFLVLIVGRTLLMLTFYLNSVKPPFHENSEIRHFFLQVCLSNCLNNSCFWNKLRHDKN